MAEAGMESTASSDSRHGLRRLWGVLIALTITVLGLLVSIDCYCNLTTLRVLACMALAAWVGWAIVLARRSRQNRAVTAAAQRSRLSAATAPWLSVAALSAVAAGWSWLLLYSATALLLFATSRTSLRVPSTLDVIRSEGRCPVRYAFDNPPVGRRIHECGLPYAQAQRGDSIVLVESLGPLGVRFDHVERER